MGWRAVSAADPCPICGSAGSCAIARDSVWCTATLTLTQSPVGWVKAGRIGTGVQYHRAGVTAALDAADVDAIRAQEGKKAKAKRIWTSCKPLVLGTPPSAFEGMGPDHPRMRAYFEARGIPLDRLPGGKIPVSLRYYGACPREVFVHGEEKPRIERVPAIVGAFYDFGRTVTGVQRIFLDPAGAPRKLDADGNKKERGDFCARTGGGAVRLSAPDLEGGTLVLVEGIETGLAVLAALGDTGATVWAVLSTSGLKAFRLHPLLVLPQVGGWVRRVIIAADHDSEKFNQRSGESMGRPGEVAARHCAEQLKADWPDLDVRIALPTAELVPEMVGPTGWVKFQERANPDGTPAEGKSVDWLDVLVAIGHERTAEGLYRPGDHGVAVDRDARRPRLEQKLLPATHTERAQLVLQNLWPPDEPHGAYRIRRQRQQWWVRDEDGLPQWRVQSDEQVEARVRHFLDPWMVLKGGVPEPAFLSGSAIADVCRAMIAFVGVVNHEVPQWLEPNVDGHKRPLGTSVLKFGISRAAGMADSSMVVTAQNGLLDVEAFVAEESKVVVHRHTTRWFNRTCLPYAVDWQLLEQIIGEPELLKRVLAERAPVFARFLRDITLGDGGRARALQEYAGYLFPPFNVYKKMLWMQGPPGGGKSAWSKLMCLLVGEGNYAMATWGTAESRFNEALVGPSLIVYDDLRIPKRSDTSEGLSRFLSMTSGAEVQVEQKHTKAVAAVRFPGKFIVCTNEDPDIPDNSGAWVDRMLFVRTGGKPARPDPFLLKKLEREVPIVALWALVGLRDLYQRQGFLQPAADADALGDIQRAMQPVAAFVADKCVVGPRWCWSRKEFAAKLNAWRREQDPECHAWSDKAIWRQLQAAGVAVSRGRKTISEELPGMGWTASEVDAIVGLRPLLFGESRAEPYGDAAQHADLQNYMVDEPAPTAGDDVPF